MKSEFKKQPKGSHQGLQTPRVSGFLVKRSQKWCCRAKAFHDSPVGDTDQINQSITSYWSLGRNRKWYWPLFIYSAKVSLYNSWLLYRNMEENCWFLDLIRSITMPYLQTYKHSKKIISLTETFFHNSRVGKRVNECIIFDGINHLIGSDEIKMCTLWENHQT